MHGVAIRKVEEISELVTRVWCHNAINPPKSATEYTIKMVSRDIGVSAQSIIHGLALVKHGKSVPVAFSFLSHADQDFIQYGQVITDVSFIHFQKVAV